MGLEGGVNKIMNIKAFLYIDGTKESEQILYSGEAEGFITDENGPVTLELGETITINALDGDLKVYVHRLVKLGVDSFDLEYHLVPEELRKNKDLIKI